MCIYEKETGVGGTWFQNRYPGHAEKKDWSALYAPWPEIRQYLQNVVNKDKLMRYIKLQHEVTGAEYVACPPDRSGERRVRRVRPRDRRPQPLGLARDRGAQELSGRAPPHRRLRSAGEDVAGGWPGLEGGPNIPPLV
ncbi:hypothetical protein C8Q76DRAFT_218178 [Earliella scabrosa]|nr:hypothetical protein C8Q76DRAFT_218178 [Earliella scabrosa]